MKKFFLLAPLLLNFLFPTTVSAAAAASDVNKTIVVGADQSELTIALPSNPSTGFVWLIDSYNSQLLKLSDHEYVAAKEAKVAGAPGIEKWVFTVKSKAIAPQMTKVVLVHVRPWEAIDSTSETASFTVVLE